MPPKKSARGKSSTKKDDEIEVEQEEEEKQTRRSTRSKSTKKEEPVSEEEEEEKPKAKRGAKADTKKGTPKKEGSKIAAKVAGKAAKKAQDDDEEEEEDEKPAKAPAKRGRKGAKKDEDEKPAAKSPAKKGRKSTKKKEESEEEEDDSEEEEEKPKAPAKRGRKSTKKEEEADKEDAKAKTTRGKRGARGKSQNQESEEAGGEDEKEKKQKKEDTGTSSTVVDSEVEINVSVKVFKKPGWIYDRYIEEDDNNDPNAKKFFKIQVLDNQYSKHQNHFYTYVRWGKVGEKGEWTLRGYFNKNRACQIYDEKIAEKMKYIKLNQANAAKKTAMQTETPTQSQPEPATQNNASTQDTANATQTQSINETPQENKTEASKTAIEDEKPQAKEATEQKTMEEEKPKTEEPAKAMEIEKEEEIKEQTSSQINRDKIDCPVDSQCPLASTTEVYIKDNEIFDTKYNASDVKKNTNHFYLFQILRNKKDPSKFYVFYRYGRVGLPGEWVLRGVFTEEQAVAAFRAKQEEKKVQNKYTALEMSYMKDDPELLTRLFSEGAGKSKLKKQVAEFIQLIFDFKMMNTQMEKAGYDPKKLPLGKLSLNMINQGFKLLSELSEAIKNNADEDKIQKLCSDFYTVIPQNVGWKNMNTMVIRTNDEIKEKLEFLESLRQIQAAYQMVHGTGDAEKSDKADIGTNPIDENYEKLKCDIDPVDPNSEEYKKISKFIDATKESYQVEIMEMFKINKHGSEENFRKDLDNHVMLWHGSRLTNFVGILSQGLRIAPPEAPVSGYRLGKGIYLADMISKSVPYCYASASNDVFCIMVCDAALGNINEKLHDDFYAGNLPADKHSTKALGHVAPPVSSYVDFEDGIKIPQGVPEKTEHNRSSFQHNEFIVYNVNQVQIRYLLKMKQKRGRGLFG